MANDRQHRSQPMPEAFFTSKDLDIDAFDTVCRQSTDPSCFPNACRVEQNIAIYDGDSIRRSTDNDEASHTLKSEFCSCLRDGPGVFVVRSGFLDLQVVDRTTELFGRIVESEKTSRQGQGDHFGNNERIWNSLQKVCVADPELFIRYFGNPLLHLASESWLGPNYQITAQMNNVRPGSPAQSPHRDYHLGFQSQHTVSQYPAHAQVMSQYLTLQGAVAHQDMPLDNGPTLFLPFSQQFAPGYLAYRRPEFVNYFETHHAQLPLQKGDVVFFNPAVFHAGGKNSTATDRVANLIQVSASFGKTMETLDYHAMIAAVYPALVERERHRTSSEWTTHDVIATVTDGYAFPTNLDSDPPIGGNSPETQRDLVQRAVNELWPLEQLQSSLQLLEERRTA